MFLRTGDLAAAQRIALADLRREGLPEGGERTLGETLEFRLGRDDHSGRYETLEFDLLDDTDHGVPLADKAASDTAGPANGGEEDGGEDDDGGRDDSGTGAPAEDEARPSLNEPSGGPTGPSDGIQNPSPPEPFEVPAWKKDMVGQDEMDRFMGHQGESGPNMRNALGETFAAEGGFKTDRQTGQAFAGITPEALEKIKKIEPSLKDVDDVNSMTDEQVAKAYRAYFDDALRRYGGPEALEDLKDPKTAAAFADTLFRHGQNGGARIIKDATNDVIKGLSSEHLRNLDLKELTDRNGPKDTLDAINRLANSGMDGELRREIADWRLRAMQKKLSQGDRNRIDHFRFPEP